MKAEDITNITDDDVLGSMAAMQRAALEARKIAIQTNTAIIVMQDGKMVRITADELRQHAAATNQNSAWAKANFYASFDKFFKNLRCPDAELRCTQGFHPITNRDNDIKVIVRNFALHLSTTLYLNHPEFPDSWFLDQLAFSIDITNMLINGSDVFLKQLCHLLLAQPYGFLM